MTDRPLAPIGVLGLVCAVLARAPAGAAGQFDDATPRPPNGRPRHPARQWVGDSRASWDGDTLVIETRNFLRETSLGGSSANMRLVERFTRVDDDTLRYEFTVNDPTTWAGPWTARVRMTRTDEPLYEYACHEGNYSMPNSLSGAPAMEAREAAESAGGQP